MTGCWRQITACRARRRSWTATACSDTRAASADTWAAAVCCCPAGELWLVESWSRDHKLISDWWKGPHWPRARPPTLNLPPAATSRPRAGLTWWVAVKILVMLLKASICNSYSYLFLSSIQMNTECEPQQKCNYVYIQLNSRYIKTQLPPTHVRLVCFKIHKILHSILYNFKTL